MGASGGDLKLRAGGQWVDNASGWTMPVGGQCQWVDNASGWTMPVGGQCQWVDNASGCTMPVGGQCQWVHNDGHEGEWPARREDFDDVARGPPAFGGAEAASLGTRLNGAGQPPLATRPRRCSQRRRDRVRECESAWCASGSYRPACRATITSIVGQGGPSRSAHRNSFLARFAFGNWSPRSQRHAATIARTRCRQSRSSRWSTPG